MATIFKLKCPDCCETFRWPGDQKWPDFCPYCQANVANDAVEIRAPFIGTAKAKATDKVYRDIEAGSEQRAQLAAGMLGETVSEMSDLKITNLLPTKIPGSVAAPPLPPNPVSQMMDAAPSMTGFQSAGAEHSGAVQTGPFANSGAKFMTQLRGEHAKRYGHGLVGDRPANEVMQPDYRRRG